MTGLGRGWKRLLGVALGVMTAIGGFVDIGNIVTSGLAGARFGMSLAWALVFGTIGMGLYGEMAGRVVAVTQRATFNLVRERLGVRAGLVNLAAALLLTGLTMAAEIGGAGITLQLGSGISYVIWVPVVGLATWLVIWRVPFGVMERVLGLLGLALVVFVVALFALPVPWQELLSQAAQPAVPPDEGLATWLFFAISLIGSAVVPYQVVFFSSGGVEEGWRRRDLGEMRLNVFVGFPLGMVLSLAIMACAVPVLQPRGVDVQRLEQVGLPVVAALGRVGLLVMLLGFFAATFAAAAECALSLGYSAAQYFGWTWGKFRRPAQAPRFHVVMLAGIIAATALMLTTIDPVQLTIVSVVLGAAAIPLTYFPILVVANDRSAMGRYVNGPWANTLGVVFLVVMVVVSVISIPLLFLTKAGQ
ncbi:MAG TPA: divalent metal cation transporter [Kineosporiaceae bacterium]|nr:divalent metal cation transporter [Kineosporiaceae bacterium]